MTENRQLFKFEREMLMEARELLSKRHDLRIGQAVFLVSHVMYPHIVDAMKDKEMDCYNDDSLVGVFLRELRLRVSK